MCSLVRSVYVSTLMGRSLLARVDRWELRGMGYLPPRPFVVVETVPSFKRALPDEVSTLDERGSQEEYAHTTIHGPSVSNSRSMGFRKGHTSNSMRHIHILTIRQCASGEAHGKVHVGS